MTRNQRAVAPTPPGSGPTAGGVRLPDAVRERLEAVLSADLDAVRVHTDTAADRLARSLGADAVAAGSEIHFRAGAYRPDTPAGLRLLGHEAAHLVQQARGLVDPADGAGPGPADGEWERLAEVAADAVLAGHGSRPTADRVVPVPAAPGRVWQRHVSYEHRALGDVPCTDLVTVSSTSGPDRNLILKQQIALMDLWMYQPESVTEAKIKELRLKSEVLTVRLGPDQVLATYGELNALPDYLADAQLPDELGADTLLPILQVIRQESHNQLTRLLTGHDPKATFAKAASSPWPLDLISTITETTALDELTLGFGPMGSDHYQGLLARNACHFAPFSWYRWLSSHLMARNLAEQAYRNNRSVELTRRARVFHGYADHFLQDSFAAGHLVNKTLAMQWFVEWAANQQFVPVADWDLVKDMTVAHQPDLSGTWLYDANQYLSQCSNDPQAAQEAATAIDRMVRSRLRADNGTDRPTGYQRYLTFLANAVTQLASALMHDHFNATSLWVSSWDQQTPYEVWGDNTLLTGANGRDGVAATSGAAELSRAALTEILHTGRSSISTRDILSRFPMSAGPSRDKVRPLLEWNLGLKQQCMDLLDQSSSRLQQIVLSLASPRLGVVSQDQSFASVWSRSLPDCRYNPVNSVRYAGRLFAGSNGYVYELHPETGAVRQELLLATVVPNPDDYETRLAVDGGLLVVGVHGWVYGVDLNNWSKPAWQLPLDQLPPIQRVSVIFSGQRLFAACNGYVYELDRGTGKIMHQRLLTSMAAVTDLDMHLAVDNRFLYVGVHGWAYGVSLDDWARQPWTVQLDSVAALREVSIAVLDGRLFASSNATVYELNRADGKILRKLDLTTFVPTESYGASMTLAGDMLCVGLHSYVYGISLADFQQRWYAKVSGVTGVDQPVSVQAVGESLISGSNGYVYQLDPVTGAVRNKLLLTYPVGVGNFDTRLSYADGRVYAGVHGYLNRLLVQHGAPAVGTLYRDALRGDGQWTHWEANPDHAPQPLESIHAGLNALGELETFAIAPDGALFHDVLGQDGRWRGWTRQFENPAAIPFRSVTVARRGEKLLEAFAISEWGVLYRDTHDGTRWSGAWSIVSGGTNTEQPIQSLAAATGPTGNLELLAAGADGTLLHGVVTPDGKLGFGQPYFDGIGEPVHSVAMAMGPTGNLEAFAVGRHGALLHDWLSRDGNWHGWTTVALDGPRPVAAVAVAMGPTANLETFVVDRDGVLLYNRLDRTGYWRGWTPAFDGIGVPVQSVSVALAPTGNLEVFVVDRRGTVLRDYLTPDDRWHGWTSNVDNAPAGTLSTFTTAGPNRELEVFAISGAGSR